MQSRVIAFVLAGGRGSRLLPLTQARAKPAVHFGGKYRIIDFALSNLINSGIYSIYVLTQYMSHSLLRHLRNGWQFGGLLEHQFIIPVAAQVRSPDDSGYKGTADAIFQNLNLIDDLDEHLIAIFGADHIYRMDISQMIDFHQRTHADVTIAAIPVSARFATEFGVIEAGSDGAVHGFHEKTVNAPAISGRPDTVYASMGNYIFSARALLDALKADALRSESKHDFGHDILPSLLGSASIYAYDYQINVIPGEALGAPVYWRDVGTLEAYFDAQMDLCGLVPSLNLYNQHWPIHTASYPDPSAKFTFDEEGGAGSAVGSIVSGGCILAGGTVRGSVLGRNTRVKGGAIVENSVILDNCTIGRCCKIRHAILDENITIQDGECIGYDLEHDRSHYHVTDTGIVTVTNHLSQ
jgi:glucose-1-phosphate adenylyltransferase